MPRSYWRIIASIVGGLAALGFLTFAASYSYREFYEPAEYEYPAERYQPARDTSYPVATKEKPTTKPYDPHCDEPQSRDDADLCAQYGAVRAVNETNRLTRIALKLGYIGFWVAVAGGVLGLVGTFYLVKTFRENQRAADAAHDANRPWIEIVVEGPERFRLADILVKADFTASLRNRGNSPATNLMARAVIVPVSERVTGSEPTLAAILKLMDEWTLRPNTGETIFPGATPPARRYGASLGGEKLAQMRQSNERVRFWVAIGVQYKFGERTGRTYHAYLLKFTNHGELFFPTEICEFGDAGFRLAEMAQEYAT